MRLFCLIFFILFTELSYAKIRLRTSRYALEEKKEDSFFDLGQTSFEFGLNYANFKGSAGSK